MASELMEIHPRELKFTFEMMKQSLCSIELVNKTNHYMAFKVKTTSPKKYCVRPNIGILDPKTSFNFTVIMQAQRVAPTDLVCKDKFLVQCAVVPEGTTDDDITSSMFVKQVGKLVEESKLKVILVNAQQSPVSLPMNGTPKQVTTPDDSARKDQVTREVQNVTSKQITYDAKNIDEKPNIMENNVERGSLQSKIEKHQMEEVMHTESKAGNDAQKLKLVKDLHEMKLKLNDFESKLREAEFTIAKLTEGRRELIQEKEILQQELTTMRNTKAIRKVQVGFPPLFVCMVTIVSIALGYLLHT
ncbi:vesicle-associated protein 2-2 [Impatiens glandulifera]|uniref:vesicle-associated protein 2-2 n=1 Tax=Impatiens glandulifera TaxID=253017 RepID=UPI001FB07ED8|nr:vesicle-associated protein 2-2 [Impatiens glandulifera]